jgi:hypothetical protein
MIKIKLGIPTYNKIIEHSPTVKALLECKDFDIVNRGKIYCQGTYIAKARNFLITESNKIWQKDFPFDYALCLDMDVQFTIGNLKQLIEADKEIICGAYPYRDESLKQFYVALWNEVRIPTTFEGVLPVDRVGAGFLLIKSSVFPKIKFPYFRHAIIEKGDYAGELGEDWGFCDQCREAGIDVFLHCNMEPKLIHKGD